MKLSAERLRRITLARQFPTIKGTGRKPLIELVNRLGPIQSQVPRAPFLTASSRLPGLDYATVRDTFADWQLVKTTNLRGTVHTSVGDHFGLLDAVSRPLRSRDLQRELSLQAVDPGRLVAEIEAFCGDDWQTRDDLVDHIGGWLTAHDPTAAPDALGRTLPANLIWGHSGLVRRPRDDHWEKRTDIYHRTARRFLPLELPEPQQALIRLARVHLRAYGPANRRDLAWWLGYPLRPVDRALADLEPELVHHTGPDGEDLVDLADSATGYRTSTDPGLRLLPEFDGLLLGYAPANRWRFIDLDQLDRIWARANGMFSPTVLLDGRIVASWRVLPGSPAKAAVIEIRPFPGQPKITAAALDAPVIDAARVLGLTVCDVRLLSP